MKKILTIMLVVVVLLLVGCSSRSSPELEAFATCITESGTKMFGAYWCSHCNAQKKMFSSGWGYINYIECSLPNRAGQTEVCQNEGIQSYPTWEFGNGQRVSGELTFAELSSFTGCTEPLV